MTLHPGGVGSITDPGRQTPVFGDFDLPGAFDS